MALISSSKNFTEMRTRRLRCCSTAPGMLCDGRHSRETILSNANLFADRLVLAQAW